MMAVVLDYPDNGNYALSFTESEDYIELAEDGFGSGIPLLSLFFLNLNQLDDLINNAAVIHRVGIEVLLIFTSTIIKWD